MILWLIVDRACRTISDEVRSNAVAWIILHVTLHHSNRYLHKKEFAIFLSNQASYASVHYPTKVPHIENMLHVSIYSSIYSITPVHIHKTIMSLNPSQATTSIDIRPSSHHSFRSLSLSLSIPPPSPPTFSFHIHSFPYMSFHILHDWSTSASNNNSARL